MAAVSSTENHQSIQNEQVATVRYFSPINGPNQIFSILRLTRGNQPLLVETMVNASVGKEMDSRLAYFLKVAATVDSYAASPCSPLYFVRAFNPIFGDRPLFVFSLRVKEFDSSNTGLEFVSKIFPPDKESVLFPIAKFSIQWVLSNLLPSISENSLGGSAKKVREVSLYFQENFLPYFYGYLAWKQIPCEKHFSFWKIRISDLLPKAENPPPLESSRQKRKHVSVKIEDSFLKHPRGSH